MCEKSVFDPIPHTQHRPICVSVNPVIVSQPTTFKIRFNLMKADWKGFSADLDSNIEEVDAIPENYERFVEMLQMASRKRIRRGCRSNYIPGLIDESKRLYEAYKNQYSMLLLLFAFQSMFISVWVSRLEIVEFPDDVCRSVP